MGFSVGQSFSILVKSWPFILLRMAVYLGVAFGFIACIGVGAGLGYLLTLSAEEPGSGIGVGGLLGVGLGGALLYGLREYILYIVKAGHVAVMGEIHEGRIPNPGMQQIAIARDAVKERFVESTILFGIDQLAKGVLKAFTRSVMTFSTHIPIPALSTLVRFGTRVIESSLTFVDELVLSYILRTNAENPWAASRDALILYAQNYKALLKSAVFLTLIQYALTFLIFILALGPMGLLAAVSPGSVGTLTVLGAMVFAWALKAAILEPFSIACLMQVYFKEIEGQAPDEEWSARLDQVSDRFPELKSNAASWIRGNETATAKPTPEIVEVSRD